MSKIEQCVNERKLTKVSAGEVCSIDTAKKLGIYDSEEYYKAGYDMIKTFDEAKDAVENRGAFSICSYNSFKKKAYPYCPIVAGVNYTTKMGDVSKCIAVECPPDFVNDENDPKKCIKPNIKKVIPLQSRNDERLHDWYSIPNYHLYNRYSSSNNTHFAPCPENMLPYFATDPVDGVATDYNASTEDQVHRCVSKDIYYGGKYAGTSDYCPISWIKRAGSTKQDIVNNITDKLTEVEKNGKKEQTTPEMRTLQNNADKEATRIIQEINKGFGKKMNLEGMINPSTETRLACDPMNTEERLKEAYDTCAKLKENEGDFTQRLINGNGDSTALASLKTKIAKYNCYELFGSDESKASLIDRENIPFDDIREIDMEKELREYEKTVKEKREVGNTITSNSEKKKLIDLVMFRSIKWLWILIFIVVLLILYFVFRVPLRKFVECYLKPFLHWLSFRSLFKFNKCETIDLEEATAKIQTKSATRAEE